MQIIKRTRLLSLVVAVLFAYEQDRKICRKTKKTIRPYARGIRYAIRETCLA